MSLVPAFEIVCFDCDSTLSRIEGIDELAKACNVGDQVAHLTQIAMDGEITLEAVYQQRLDMICPDQQAVTALAQLYIDEMVNGVQEVFKSLLLQGKQVHIISGGLRQAILPLAELLHIPAQNVHAVDIYFNAEGSYAGFNQDSPLARSGGKAEICALLNPDNVRLAMVGDGQTDLESKQVGAYFIGFGGVVSRAAVQQQADVFVEDHSLLTILPYLN